MSEIKQCPSCDTPLSESYAFCYNCGMKQKESCAESQVPIEKTESDNTDMSAVKEEKAPEEPQKPINNTKEQPQEIKTQEKKRFPWFFTVLWTIMLLAVGIWAYFLLIDVSYDYPKFTEDAQRIVLFTIAVAFLIYTLSLKITMQRFRAFPTVILVVATLIIFYFFSMVELTDGDLLHDILSNITNSILSSSGK